MGELAAASAASVFAPCNAGTRAAHARTTSEPCGCDFRVGLDSRGLGPGDPHEAIRILLQSYGAEILRYLRAVLSYDDAQDVYSEVEERLLRGIAAFRGDCPVRAWAYRVARNAARQFSSSAYQRRRVRLRTSFASKLPQRSMSSDFAGARAKDRIRRLKALLKPDELTLLVLRIEQRMSWDDVARVLSAEETVSAATVRKRFERLKARLKREARESGLIEW